MSPSQEPLRKQLPTVENALLNLSPGSSWSVKYDSNGRDYEITWLDKTKRQPTTLEIKKEIQRLDNKWRSNTYRRAREAEYPKIGDQLDALYHAGVFPDEMKKKIEEIKKKYPKPKS